MYIKCTKFQRMNIMLYIQCTQLLHYFSKNIHNFVYSMYSILLRMYKILYIPITQFLKEYTQFCILNEHNCKKCTQFYIFNIYIYDTTLLYINSLYYTILWILYFLVSVRTSLVYQWGECLLHSVWDGAGISASPFPVLWDS